MTDHDRKYVVAIDQGTTSSRCIIFDQGGAIVAIDQREHRQIFPKPGWVEHNATGIWSNVQAGALGRDRQGRTRADQISALGITNQRETTVLWDRATGKPVHNAIVWQDTRTAALCNELGGSARADRAAARELLLRAQGGLAARQRARFAVLTAPADHPPLLLLGDRTAAVRSLHRRGFR